MFNETLEEMMARHEREREESRKKADASVERLHASIRREGRVLLVLLLMFLGGAGWLMHRAWTAEEAAVLACSERQCDVGKPMRVQLTRSVVCVCLQEVGR